MATPPPNQADPRNDPTVKQPTAAEKAAQEKKWGDMVTAPKSLADLILLVAAHPEWIEWANASKAGTFRV